MVFVTRPAKLGATFVGDPRSRIGGYINDRTAVIVARFERGIRHVRLAALCKVRGIRVEIIAQAAIMRCGQNTGFTGAMMRGIASWQACTGENGWLYKISGL
jgi:hypothetical protein